jgi:Asp-tRNA(Asn)/Glu-tRNA(Gln) amidotransferase B subunit
MNTYETVIGLEIHAQLKTKSKIFCSCKTDFDSPSNSTTCEVCLGLPGTLPVLNEKALDFAVKTAIALNCKIQPISSFARKNYFYPDLPKGFQITQKSGVLAIDGYIEIENEEQGKKSIKIARVQLEEDAGKSIHVDDDGSGKGCSLVDYNRCGVPLIEIITEPDISSPKEARLFLNKLKTILLYLDVCDCNMEEGSLRCDANLSLRLQNDNIISQLKLLRDERDNLIISKSKLKNELRNSLKPYIPYIAVSDRENISDLLYRYNSRISEKKASIVKDLISKLEASSDLKDTFLRYIDDLVRTEKEITQNKSDMKPFIDDLNSKYVKHNGSIKIAKKFISNKLLGTKTEIKNLNSFKFVQKALEYEEKRQAEILNSGGKISEDTLTYDDSTGTTRSIRSKEQSHDYRYFPEPDLVFVNMHKDKIENIRKTLPELPEEKKFRFIEDYNLSPYDAGVLTSSKGIANYFENALQVYNNPKKICNWITTELLATMEDPDEDIQKCKIKPDNLALLVKLIDDEKISGKIAKQVFPDMLNTGKSPDTILKEKNLIQISDEASIDIIVAQVMDENKDLVQQIREGKDRPFGYLVGQIMKKTRGQANPALVNKLLRAKINS